MGELETVRTAQKLLLTRYHHEPRYLAKLVVVMPHVPMFASFEFCHPDFTAITDAAHYFGWESGTPKYIGNTNNYTEGQQALNLAARMYAAGYNERAEAFITADTAGDRERISKAWGSLCRLARLTYCYTNGSSLHDNKRMFKEARNPHKLVRNIEHVLENDYLSSCTNRDLITAVEQNVITVPGVAPAILSRYFALLEWRYEDADRLRKQAHALIKDAVSDLHLNELFEYELVQ
ncbi:MAG TPA: hypothetical protein VLJ21_03165 [Candidatus Binatia bacterium]|nr:hypothetical protein [Candidatus Binatia bacterium]